MFQHTISSTTDWEAEQNELWESNIGRRFVLLVGVFLSFNVSRSSQKQIKMAEERDREREKEREREREREDRQTGERDRERERQTDRLGRERGGGGAREKMWKSERRAKIYRPGG